MKIVLVLLAAAIMSACASAPGPAVTPQPMNPAVVAAVAVVPAIQPFPQPAAEIMTQNGKFVNLSNVAGLDTSSRVTMFQQYLRQVYEWYGKYGQGAYNFDAFESNVNRLVNVSMSPATGYGRPLSAGDGASALQFRGNLLKNEIERLVRWAQVNDKWYLLPTTSFLSQAVTAAAVAVTTIEFFIVGPMVVNPCLPQSWNYAICGMPPNPQQ